jgi:hypothetical protein
LVDKMVALLVVDLVEQSAELMVEKKAYQLVEM